MSNCIRSLQRGVAKNKMKKKGITQACKHDYVGKANAKSVIPSWFAEHWRLYLPTKKSENPIRKAYEKRKQEKEESNNE